MVAALSEDVRVVIENVVPVGEFGEFSDGDVIGLEDSNSAFDVGEVGELNFDDEPGGLRRALRSGIGGGNVVGSGSSIEVFKEKLLSESGVAGGEGGRSGAKGCAANGVLPYRLCGTRRGGRESLRLWESFSLRIAEARIVFEEEWLLFPNATTEP